MTRRGRTICACLVVVAVGLAVGGGSNLARAQSSTAGAVRGVITDRASRELVVGATVVATSTALQGHQAAITDAKGAYFLDKLPPGTYTLSVFYADATTSRGNVLIQVGKQAVVNIPIAEGEGEGEGEVIEMLGNAPIIDQGSTKVGLTITREYAESLPVGRTFGAVLGAAAGASEDAWGTGFSGSTSSENTYIVEGINTTDSGFGQLVSLLPNEFIEETEVITGGYAAELGRSTGAVVNVVTKSGSNELHGSAFAYYTPGALAAASDPVDRGAGTIGAQTDLTYEWDVGAELGGPIVKDRLWFHVGFNPTRARGRTQRIINARSDDNHDAVADIDPETGFVRRTEVGRQSLDVHWGTDFFTAKITGAVTDRHRFQIAAWGNPASATDVWNLVGAPSGYLAESENGAYDAAAKWTSGFAGDAIQVEALAGYHRGYLRVLPRDRDTAAVSFQVPRDLSAYAEHEPSLPSGCGVVPTDIDGDGNPDRNFNLCPVPGYRIGGFGDYFESASERISASTSVAVRFRLAGHHRIKAGFEVDQSKFDDDFALTGGELYNLDLDRTWRRVSLLEPDADGSVMCGDAACREIEHVVSDARTRNFAAYVQDSWQIRPNLTVNAGLRWERQTAFGPERLAGDVSPTGEVIPAVAYELANLWAPRLGVIYDPTQQGRSKLFAHWGRFYETVPVGMTWGGFSRFTNRIQEARPDQCPDATASLDPAVIAGCFADAGSYGEYSLGGNATLFAPGTDGQHLDEVVVGVEHEPARDLKLTAAYVHREIHDVIEDMTADSINTYVIGNPGEDYDDVAAALHQDALALGLEACSDLDDANDPATCARAFELESQSFSAGEIENFDPLVRRYDALQLGIHRRFTDAVLVVGSYTYTRQRGNYSGLVQTDNDQLFPNLTSVGDLPAMSANRYGRLPDDRPHSVKLDGFYRLDLGDAGLLAFGASVRAQSGVPVNAFAVETNYGHESMVLPRGTGERAPVTWRADVKLSYGYRLAATTKVEAFVDVFNLLDNQTTTWVDQAYTNDVMNPIVGGDREDLAHGKVIVDGMQTGVTAIRSQNYGRMAAHQDPRTFRFGVRLSF